MSYEKKYHFLNFIDNVEINKNINPYTNIKEENNEIENSFLICFFDFFNTRFNKNELLLNFDNFKKYFFDYLLKNNFNDNNFIKNDILNKCIHKKTIKKLISTIFKINIKIYNKNLEMIEYYQNIKFPNICLNLIFDKKFELYNVMI